MAAARGSRMQKSAPDKGSFPLDHGGACKDVVQQYLGCLKEGGNAHYRCAEFTKAYLSCRMDRNLMKREPLSALGFGYTARTDDDAVARGSDGQETPPVDLRAKEKVGFISGLGVKPLGGNKIGWNADTLRRQRERKQSSAE